MAKTEIVKTITASLFQEGIWQSERIAEEENNGNEGLRLSGDCVGDVLEKS
jgi:hypothetical protein